MIFNMIWILNISIAIVLLFYGIFIEPNKLNIQHISIRSPVIKKGFSILHASDFHLFKGISAKRLSQLKNKMDLIIQNGIDLFLVTGDMVDSNDGIGMIPELFSGLKPKIGSYCVLGNHDYFEYNFLHIFQPLLNVIDKKLIDQVHLSDVLKKSGFQLLKDEKTVITVKGQTISIIGLDAFTKNVKQEWLNHDEDFSIVLSHYPDLILKLQGKTDLVLSGHTHGGQVTFFGIPLTVKTTINKNHARGISVYSNTILHVSKGTGVSRYFPIRFFAEPDISIIRVEGIDE